MNRVIRPIVLALYFVLALSCRAGPQKQPDTKRVAQIHDALLAHGYATGPSWSEVQAACRKIADDNGWQVNRAPDARVLILLGLGNQYSNLWVATQPGTHLDKSQRHERE